MKTKADKLELIKAAMGEIPCDKTIVNVRHVNVFTGEILKAEVDIYKGYVISVRTGNEPSLQKAKEIIDGEGLYMIPGYVDTHMHIESTLIGALGDEGARLHSARSRNDQVALDIRLYLRDEADLIIENLKDLISAILYQAEQHKKTIMPGYTHLQRAQPITFGHHLMAYFEMLKRDYKRLTFSFDNTNYCPLGSGALATTTYPLDRYDVAHTLHFTDICENSIDGVSDRDFCLDLLYSLSTLMMHLSRFSEEVIIWNSNEYQFVDIDDAYSTGSSIMPQKKNPDIAELVRGKTGRVYGALMSMLTTMKGIPLAYNKDMQEDKEAIFDAIDTVKMCLGVFTPMVATMTVLKDNMYKAAGKGFINATDLADYLTKKGMPFRSAYKIVGQIVAECIEKRLRDLLLSLGRTQYRIVVRI